MKKILPILLVTLFSNWEVVAQKTEAVDEYPVHAVYLELGGPTLLYSLGYEGTLHHTPKFSVITSIGFQYIPTNGSIYAGYLQPGVLFHFNKSAIELGLAINHMVEAAGSSRAGSANMTSLVPRVGFRYTFQRNRLFLKFGFTPLIIIDESETSDSGGFLPWANLATFGVRF